MRNNGFKYHCRHSCNDEASHATNGKSDILGYKVQPRSQCSGPLLIHGLGLGPRNTRFNVALGWRSCTIHPLVWVGAYDHHEMSNSMPLVVKFSDLRLTKVRVPVRKDVVHKAMDELSMETSFDRCLLDQHLGSIAWPTKVDSDILLSTYTRRDSHGFLPVSIIAEMELLVFCLLFLCGQYVQALSPFSFSQTTLTTERSPSTPTSTKSTTATASSSRTEAIIDSQQYDSQRIEGRSLKTSSEIYNTTTSTSSPTVSARIDIGAVPQVQMDGNPVIQAFELNLLVHGMAFATAPTEMSTPSPSCHTIDTSTTTSTIMETATTTRSVVQTSIATSTVVVTSTATNSIVETAIITSTVLETPTTPSLTYEPARMTPSIDEKIAPASSPSPTPTADCSVQNESVILKYQLSNINGWASDGGSEVKDKVSDCGIVTGWDWKDGDSGLSVSFEISTQDGDGCVENAISSAGGPQISCGH